MIRNETTINEMIQQWRVFLFSGDTFSSGKIL